LDMGYPFFLYFPISHVSFWWTLGEREVTPHTELYFYGMNGRYNANFQCRRLARGYGGVHMNNDHESMKRILTRVTTIWQTQCNNKQHMNEGFSW
jgi:hypothetical protein